MERAARIHSYGPPERLSFLSSREGPWFSVSHDGVEDDEELSDEGDEGLLAGFPRGAKLLIVGGDDGIGSAGDPRGHVGGGSFGRLAAGAVAIDRRHADEGRDFAPVEAPEFRQLGDEGAQGGLAHARHAGQKVGVGLPGGALSDRPVDVAIEVGKFGLEKIDMPIDGLEHPRLARETTTIFLRHDHLDDLPSAGHEFTQRLGFVVSHSWAGGRMASAKWAIAAASRRSGLASLPVERAKSRICRGLTTASGRWAAARALAATVS